MPVFSSTPSSIHFLPQIDVNYILINRIFVLAVTLLFFTSILLFRRIRAREINPRIIAPIKLALFGIVLLYAELAMGDLPSYQSVLKALQTIVVLLCLAKLVIYLIIDTYLRIHTGREVPSLIREVIGLVVYLAAGIVSLRVVFQIDLTAILTTTSVITAAVAFAMKNVFANAMSGFSIQNDKLLAQDNWISIKDKNIFGRIVNVGFRYTTLRTLENSQLMVPNSIIIQNIVTYHGNSETEDKPALQMDVMLGYDMPPETARKLLMKVLRDEPDVLSAPEPVVKLMSLNESGITYLIRFWISDPASRLAVQDAVYSQVWYAVNRAGYSFPFPHRQIITTQEKKPFVFSRSHIADELRRMDLFAMLDDDTIAALAARAPVQVYGQGEVVVRQGDAGSSLYVVLKGSLEVSVDGTVVGSIQEDSFFGEMSLLTGELRSATVRVLSEVWLAEITKESLEPLLRANPDLLEALSSVLTGREQSTKASLQGSAGSESASSRRAFYLKRLKHFFRL